MPEMTRQEAKDLIHQAGLRATAPRVAVLRLLTASPKPLSHSEVVVEVGTDEWDPATLYRNLLKLVEVNLARVASKVGGVTRYEARDGDDDPHVHPHFSCQACGKVECLPGAKLAGSVEVRWHESLADSQLQLIGNCPECIEAMGREDPPKAATTRSKGSTKRLRADKGMRKARGETRP